MRSNRRQLAISLALIFATAFSCTIVQGQDAKGLAPAPSDWSAINSVPNGDKLLVKLKNGQSVEGSLKSSSNDALALSVKGKSMDVKREDVLSVHHVTGKSATRATLIGLAVGAGGGTAIGLAGSSGSDSFSKIDHAATAGLAVIGAGAGATIGYLIGRKSRKRVLIYQATKP
jgi:hypothetical protein